jgi:hypothetical protein
MTILWLSLVSPSSNSIKVIVVTYAQSDSNIRVLYIFLGFLKNRAQNTQNGKGMQRTIVTGHVVAEQEAW